MIRYIILASFTVVIVVAFALAVKCLGIGTGWRDVFGGIAVVPLLAALFTLVRDDAARQHAESLQNQNNAFILSATSHMATVSFDKHVAFAEKYVAEVQRCMGELFRQGATEDGLALAFSLYAIRREYLLWETESISTTLDKFEQALQNMGAQTHRVRTMPQSEERLRIIDEQFEILKKILDSSDASENLSSEIRGKTLIQRLRELLGIAELTALRRYYLAEALKRWP
jgi:hypothetical protein